MKSIRLIEYIFEICTAINRADVCCESALSLRYAAVPGALCATGDLLAVRNLLDAYCLSSRYSLLSTLRLALFLIVVDPPFVAFSICSELIQAGGFLISNIINDVSLYMGSRSR